MGNTILSAAQLEQLRRDAKRLAKKESIVLHEAQTRLATQLGFANWSLLAKSVRTSAPPASHPPAFAPPSFPEHLLPRHYVHGDQSEDDPKAFYCVQCDLFAPASHFPFGHEKSMVKRYVRDLRAWADRLAPTGQWRRRENTVNLLVAAAEREEAQAQLDEVARSPFHRWIEQQRHRDDRIGDIAGDILSDATFPATASSVDQLRRYLRERGAAEAVIASFDDAFWEFYYERDTNEAKPKQR